MIKAFPEHICDPFACGYVPEGGGQAPLLSRYPNPSGFIFRVGEDAPHLTIVPSGTRSSQPGKDSMLLRPRICSKLLYDWPV